MASLMTILFSAGGSIGHIAPCIAVWRQLEKLAPGSAVHFACSTMQDDVSFLQEERVPFTPLTARRVTALMFPVAFVKAWILLSSVKPDVILSKGGGVTVPIAIAAWMKRIPIVVHESDSVPGRATRLISKFAKVVCYGFADENEKLKMNSEKSLVAVNSNFSFFIIHSVYSGNPLRTEIISGSRDQGLAITGFNGQKPILLVTGGSQGAQTFNEVVASKLEALLPLVDVIHLTGRGKNAAVPDGGGYWSRPFVHEELPHLYAISTLALARAGAGSISELAANGIPAILVPLEGVAHDHQLKNAEAAVLSGGCLLLRQASLAKNLLSTVQSIAGNTDLRTSMSGKIRSLHKPDADVAVAKILLAYLGEDCPMP